VPAVDVLLVSLGSTAGLRTSDEAFATALRDAGAMVAVARAHRPREVRTLMLTDLVWAVAARRAARRGIAEHEPRAVIYSTTTAAMFWPRPGAVRYDASAAANRPGRHGSWQRRLEHLRLGQAPLLVPQLQQTLDETPPGRAPAVVVPIAVAPSGPPATVRDVAALTYAADPNKKGLDRILEAWRVARRDGEELVVAGLAADHPEAVPTPGVRYTGMLDRDAYRALLRRSRVFVTAPRREDYGVAQLEALVDGAMLVTNAPPGPYAALPIARALDPRLVGDDLAAALRVALDDPVAGYAARAAELCAPYAPSAVVADATQVLERLGLLR
jgi:hypothetical protein